VAHAFQGAVVEVEVGRLQVARQGVEVDGEAVILGGDLDAPGELVQDRLIGAPISLSGNSPLHAWRSSPAEAILMAAPDKQTVEQGTSDGHDV
jgi:hypothetical protein